MNRADGGVLAPKGFSAGAAAAGIKAGGGPDVALIWSESPAVTAAGFARNSILAAPARLSRKNVRNHDVRAIVVNSGNANCMTGKEGEEHARRMAEDTAKLLGIGAGQVLVASTGIIGRPLPIGKVSTGIRSAFDHKASGAGVAKAIMTTDTRPKSVAYTCEVGGKAVAIGGCAKGSGMIQPNMATMLAFLTTDAAIKPELLDKALREAVKPSFNSITVDGCSSTNDTVSVMANGQAGNPAITEEDQDYQTFLQALKRACLDLALMIVRDGEGATMLVTVNVQGAKDYGQAKTIAYAVANSPLVKTATHAKTENWGRIAQAVGALGLDITEDTLDMKVDRPAKDELAITVTVQLGAAEATVYTCDLTKEYVDINVEYN
ncbi:MAG TPA: bifunctional glutamate N-acetyltransferase/amino-acid acetyltransferase ArgJ [Candidatus Saccharimonadales bacterium]|nr:bifunctional glutamate N-acetyltransferase/amino-acid acetyltransferase ArgJ [Candidatus Saccharimonadales bacterium]